VNVVLPDEKEFTAKVVGTDPQTDLTVVKMNAKNLPAVTVTDSDNVDVGGVVLAVGNPWSPTAGLVSSAALMSMKSIGIRTRRRKHIAICNFGFAARW
jgi:serine protease Do